MANEKFSSFIKGAKDKASKAVDKANLGKIYDGTKDKISEAQASIIDAIDENGNGQIDIEDIIIKGLKTPGIKINRSEFLRTELKQRYDEEIINKVIATTPLEAGISVEDIDVIANAVIQHERLFVSGISTALGAPGGVAMVATVPADILQYYAYMLRTIEKLLYLYGYPQIDMDEKDGVLDTATINLIIVCFGAMYAVKGANDAIVAISRALAKGVEKQLLKKALTKGTIYPIVKQVAKWFGINMTKELFAGFFKKSIPVIGGVIGGGITYATFKPCCDKLKDVLRNTELSNEECKVKNNENQDESIDEILEVDFEEVGD